MLEGLTAAQFSSRIGESFVLRLDGGEPPELELVLSEVAEGPVDPRPPEARRAPFSLLFRGPASPALPQRIYKLRHRELGELEIFLVPIRRDAQGLVYEAIFG
ncbi:DUF6916 family protein [Vulgatibacter incomptus]|uniref:DUF6916 domain-containing protein n=1 Tax=Vulgatibacter incomptus TaxID=1391653 RepID=A0A0K1PEL7_9BACT|nr:hypothetical protein [Vulgatibacter incomptus]AKU91978.1 hypothetical protein AKJ08_2365 [Vulgatibacter incomptus]